MVLEVVVDVDVIIIIISLHYSNYNASFCHDYRYMRDILKDKEQLECFRNFLVSRGEDNPEAPMEFWLAVEELKGCKDKEFYESKITQVKERFLSGNAKRCEFINGCSCMHSLKPLS